MWRVFPDRITYTFFCLSHYVLFYADKSRSASRHHPLPNAKKPFVNAVPCRHLTTDLRMPLSALQQKKKKKKKWNMSPCRRILWKKSLWNYRNSLQEEFDNIVHVWSCEFKCSNVVSVLAILKAYYLISYKGCSQNCQNLNFLHLFVALLLVAHFPKGIRLNYFGIKWEYFSHKLSCMRLNSTQKSMELYYTH